MPQLGVNAIYKAAHAVAALERFDFRASPHPVMGAPTLNARRRLTSEHSIEVVGEKLRSMMPWIRKNKLVDQSRN